jgi:predicted O-methyltransferase YrrM
MAEQARATEHAVPDTLNVPGPNEQTVDFVERCGARVVAEIGIYEGATSERLAAVLGARDGELHLFDFDDRVDRVATRLRATTRARVIEHPNSRKLMDSYNWSLMKLIAEHPEPVFDYVFIDGSHLWGIDALTFFLADRLLRPGGHIDFDDYDWSLELSATMNPRVLAQTAELHTDEQIEAAHVALIVDLLARRDPRYEEVVPRKVFRKADPGPAAGDGGLRAMARRLRRGAS